MMTYTPMFTALYMTLIVLLGMNVSRLRMSKKISMGDGDDKTLRNAIRTHANALEHILPFILLLFFCEVTKAPSMAILGLGIAFGVGRLMHVVGLLGGVHIARRLGAAFTYLLQLGAVGLLLFKTLL